MSSSSLAKASFRLPWGREEVIVAVEAIVGDLWEVSLGLVLFVVCKWSLSLLLSLISVV
jgi:hypothetical protein